MTNGPQKYKKLCSNASEVGRHGALARLKKLAAPAIDPSPWPAYLKRLDAMIERALAMREAMA